MHIVTCWWSIVKSALELTRDEFLDDIMCVEQVTLHHVLVMSRVWSCWELSRESRVDTVPWNFRYLIVDRLWYIQRFVRNVLLLTLPINFYQKPHYWKSKVGTINQPLPRKTYAQFPTGHNSFKAKAKLPTKKVGTFQNTPTGHNSFKAKAKLAEHGIVCTFIQVMVRNDYIFSRSS